MSDIGNHEAPLDFESKTSPVKIHENWLMHRLDQITIDSETRIKSETMTPDNKSFLKNSANTALHAFLAGQTPYLADSLHNIKPITNIEDIRPAIVGGLRVVTFLSTIAAGVLYGKLSGDNQPRMPRRIGEMSKDLAEKIKKIDTPKKNG